MLNRTSSLDSTMHFHAYGFGWDLFDYHGKIIVNHSGGLDGMISHVALVPEENLGLVILTNSTNYLPSALMYKTIDYMLDIGERDWSTEFLAYLNNYNDRLPIFRLLYRTQIRRFLNSMKHRRSSPPALHVHARR